MSSSNIDGGNQGDNALKYEAKVNLAGPTEISGGPGKPSRPKKAPIAGNVFQLVQKIYTAEFKRPKLKKSDVDLVRTGPLMSEPERSLVLDLAMSDITLTKTRQLLLIGLQFEGSRIQSELCGLSRDVLKLHPLFRDGSLPEVLDHLPGAGEEERLAKFLVSRTYDVVYRGERDTPMSKVQFRRCKTTALHCLLLFWAMRGLTVEHVHRLMQAALWSPTTSRQVSPAGRLAVLIESKDPGAASVTYQLLSSELAEQKRRMELAQRAEENGSRKVIELTELLREKQTSLDEMSKTIESLQVALDGARKDYATARAHWEDDYAKLRGRVLGRLKTEISLLEEGLHALKREPPKVHVMLDHAERAVDALRDEANRLREKD